tara:strand:- start:574 stop:936 length:363 start_codon:yes stop_codon:yes gene_type:complete
MKTIRLNGRSVQVSAEIERVLRILKNAGYVAKKSAFVEGSSYKYQRYLLGGMDNRTLMDLGIAVILKPQSSLERERLLRRERRFFEDNPRCEYAISGDAKRINMLTKKLHGTVGAQRASV